MLRPNKTIAVNKIHIYKCPLTFEPVSYVVTDILRIKLYYTNDIASILYFYCH